MTHAYSNLYLEKARLSLARMLEYSVNNLGFVLSDFWNKFLVSSVCSRFERGDVNTIVGKSGIELVYEIIEYEKDLEEPVFALSKSPEYWTGWALAYYQWMTNQTFANITNMISIDKIRNMYFPYHEMDIRQFSDEMIRMQKQSSNVSKLKQIRMKAGLSQSELAREADIPVRTIQQYEQGKKNINNANISYIIALSTVLFCQPSDLMEL